MFFDSDDEYVIKTLEKVPFALSEMVKIEFRNVYALRSEGHTLLIFYSDTNRFEIKGLMDISKRVHLIAKKLHFNKITVSIDDGTHSFFSHVGTDSIQFEKSESNEIVFFQPAMYRVNSPLDRNIILVFLLLIAFSVTSIAFPLALLAGFIEKIVGLILVGLLFGCLWAGSFYGLVNYFQYRLRRKKEHRTFHAKELSNRHYPSLVANSRAFIYKIHGKEEIIPWENVQSLNCLHGENKLTTFDGTVYPIPDYQLISIFDNKLLSAIIIRYAALKERGKNYWSK